MGAFDREILSVGCKDVVRVSIALEHFKFMFLFPAFASTGIFIISHGGLCITSSNVRASDFAISRYRLTIVRRIAVLC